MILSHLSCVQLFATPWTAAQQAPLSMGFSRKEYWNGVPLPSPVLSTRYVLIYYSFYSCIILQYIYAVCIYIYIYIKVFLKRMKQVS